MKQLPKDTNLASTDRQGMGIVHNTFSSTGEWEFRQITGRNVGTDCELELIEHDEYTGFMFTVHAKSTKIIEQRRNKRSEDFSVPIKISTLNYLLNKSGKCLVLLVNVLTSDIYFLHIRQYVENNPDIKKKLSTEQETVKVRVPAENLVSERMEELQALVKQR